MRGAYSKSSLVGLGGFMVCGSLLLAHCGNSDDTSPPEQDGSASDATPDATSGKDSMTEEAGGDGGPDATVEAGEDAVANHTDGGPDAQPDTTSDAGPDGSPDGALDATPDAPADGGDGGADAAEAGIHCDVDAQTPCEGGSSVMCCSGFCVDTAADPANCGSCGTACTSGQFCTGTACDPAIVAKLCDNPRGTVVDDQFPTDIEAGTSLGAALKANCLVAPTIVELSQDEAGVLDPNTDRPITGVGNTFINGGGSFGQRGVGYLDRAGISSLFLTANGGAFQIQSRALDGSVVDAASSSLNTHHDFFYVQLVVEPQSGTLCFSVIGILAYGTQAGSYYVASQVIKNRATYTASWYVFEWTDANNDSIGNAGDTFTMVASGPAVGDN